MNKFILGIFATFVVVITANKELLKAVSDGNLDLVERLLQTEGVDVNYTDHIPEVRYGVLISNSLLRALDFDLSDEKAQKIAMAIIEANANPNTSYMDGITALHMACLRGSIKVVNELLKRNADIEAIHLDYGTPLNIVIMKRYTELALLLIENYKPNLEAKTLISLKTPLQQACYYENVAVVKALLDKEVNLDDFDKDGDTAMHIAASQGNVEIMKILREKGASVDFGNGIKPPLHEAVNGMNARIHPEKSLEAAKILIETFGANVDTTDEHGFSALHIATFQRNRNMVLMLMAHGADQHLKNKEGVSPNDLALQKWKTHLRNIRPS